MNRESDKKDLVELLVRIIIGILIYLLILTVIVCYLFYKLGVE
jgi:hypothetical protein